MNLQITQYLNNRETPPPIYLNPNPIIGKKPEILGFPQGLD